MFCTRQPAWWGGGCHSHVKRLLLNSDQNLQCLSSLKLHVASFRSCRCRTRVAPRSICGRSRRFAAGTLRGTRLLHKPTSTRSETHKIQREHFEERILFSFGSSLSFELDMVRIGPQADFHLSVQNTHTRTHTRSFQSRANEKQLEYEGDMLSSFHRFGSPIPSALSLYF